MTFRCVWGDNLPGHSSGRHADLYIGEQRLCALNTWAFASCACFSIQNFSGWCMPALQGKEQEFFDFLCSSACEDTWLPDEVYFLLTDQQLKEAWAKRLVAVPKVALRDRFTNKAHDGRMCNLYRYSLAEDFLPVPKKRKKHENA